MSGRLRFRAAWVFGTVLILSYVAIANFVPEEQRARAWYLPDEGIRLGLDLRGGIHWVLGVRLEEAIHHELSFLRDRLAERLDEAGAEVGRVALEGERLVVEAPGEEALRRARELAGETGVLEVVESGKGRLVLELGASRRREVREQGMAQVLEVLRRRIDDPIKGIPDSVVTRQGADRILVQVPGGHMDRQRLRALLETTGVLEFKIVEAQAPTDELLLAQLGLEEVPEGKEIVHEVDPETGRVIAAYLVSETPAITGEYLADARVGTDAQGRWIVNFRWNPDGARIFAELTEKNIGKPLAIILDGTVRSAPVIQSRIASQGQITGRFTSEQAADLAIVLRAGSLSVPVEIEEERTVGPALGADSIRAGIRAAATGLVLVVAFSCLYYRLCGVYASLGLVCNLLMIIGVMSLARATLTLPGIAGLVLTVGMAIDGNVIIFERIREELREGRLPRAAVQTGFSKALWTILDANITTLITAIVLFEYGTGPIKGFAVTLSIGIVTSVFCALVLTRLLLAIYPGDRRVAALSI